MRLTALCALALVTAIGSSACAKSSSSSSASATASAEPAAATSAPASAGQTAYTANCASCHQGNGKGLTGSFPPLAGNPVVTGDPKHVIHIVKYGLSGKISVGPDFFNGMMPPWAGQLSDAGIAGVITYIRSSWGNKAGPVTAAEVTAVGK